MLVYILLFFQLISKQLDDLQDTADLGVGRRRRKKRQANPRPNVVEDDLRRLNDMNVDLENLILANLANFEADNDRQNRELEELRQQTRAENLRNPLRQVSIESSKVMPFSEHVMLGG